MKSGFIFLLAAGLLAQQPKIDNATVESRASAGSIAAQITALGGGPYWLGYSQPVTPQRGSEMCSDGHLVSGTPVRLEGQTAMAILIRVEAGRIDDLRVTSPDCHLDAAGMRFYWLTGVPAAESVTWMKSQAVTGRRSDTALMALSRTQDQTSVDALIDLARNDRDPHVRAQSLFWLAQRATKQAVDTIQSAVVYDPETSVRERAVFAISQLPNGQGVPLLMDAAKTSTHTDVRQKAMFWLGQSKDSRAIDFFTQILKTQ